MKKIFSIALIAILLIGSSLQAQWVSNGRTQTKSNIGLDMVFSGVVDSTGQTNGSLISDVFSLMDYDGVQDIDYSYLVTNALGTPKVKVTLLHSNETTTAASMVAAVLQDSIKTTVEASTYKAFQGIRSRYYRLKVEGLAKGRKSSTFSIHLILPKRDY